MHSFFHLRFGFLKVLQSFCRPLSSSTSAVLAWTLSCCRWPALGRDSCEQTVYGSSIGFGSWSRRQIREEKRAIYPIFL